MCTRTCTRTTYYFRTKVPSKVQDWISLDICCWSLPPSYLSWGHRNTREDTPSEKCTPFERRQHNGTKHDKFNCLMCLYSQFKQSQNLPALATKKNKKYILISSMPSTAHLQAKLGVDCTFVELVWFSKGMHSVLSLRTQDVSFTLLNRCSQLQM